MDVTAILYQLGVALDACTGTDLVVHSPIDGSQLARLRCHTQTEVQASIAQAAEASWSGETSRPHSAAPWCACLARRYVRLENLHAPPDQ